MKVSKEIEEMHYILNNLDDAAEIFYVGSYPFFHNYSDYICHDIDQVNLINNEYITKNKSIRKVKGKYDIFIYNINNKEELLDFVKHFKVDNVEEYENIYEDFCILCPGIIKYFNITVDDIRQFAENFKHKNDKHKYQKIIYDSYIENNEMYLTQEQLDKAYEEYKKYRPDIYGKDI